MNYIVNPNGVIPAPHPVESIILDDGVPRPEPVETAKPARRKVRTAPAPRG
ncbi:hypothetical protein ACFSTI_12925 [Rhizorhabdus histidinilytica]